ncbi:MAG: tRNA (N(6)-L-threonylcarbamoyladenosine(37)-C(2))-methylthiotransferase MtaB [Dongiaceae bacterium]
MNDLHIVTLGCRLNMAESETMRAHAAKAGLDAAVIVNGCAVTGEAMRQTRQAIRRAKRDHPAARIVVTGCAAQIDANGFAAMPEVDAVIGNDEKMRPAILAALARRLSVSPDSKPETIVAVGDIMALRDATGHPATGFDADTRNGHARAFVEVQQGCDHRCSFCIIPFGRGNNRSAPAGEIVAQVRALVESGVREIVLTGVDITGWGGDLPGAPTLGQLARRILRLVPELGRLRFSSIDVAEIDDELLRLVADEPRLMPHLHLSLQAGSDLILKRMKRRHSRAQAIAFCRHARTLRPDITFGADLIAGFPTESGEMFAESLDLVAACDLAFLHVFPFSARNGTPAARMPQLPKALRKERAAQLREAGVHQRARYFDSLIGRSVCALVENRRTDRAHGHSDGFALIDIACEGTDIGRGALVTARVISHDGARLSARLIDDRCDAVPHRSVMERLVSVR